MNTKPDFFLTTAGDYENLAAPRACWVKGRMKDQIRDDHMLIEIEPPLEGEVIGPGRQDIRKLILSARFVGSSLFPVAEWPCHVYVSRILDAIIIETMTINRGQVEMFAWGRIHRTFDEATTEAEKFR